jgi:hypothetical protein
VAKVAALPTTLIDGYLSHGRHDAWPPTRWTRRTSTPTRVLVPFCEREGIADVAAIDGRALDRLSAWLLERGGKEAGRSRPTRSSTTPARSTTS